MGYPTAPVRIIVPLPQGGPADLLARLLAEHLSPRLGQPVVVDNCVGNNTITGTEKVARADPDGHTLLMVPSQFAVHPRTTANLPYDVVKDFRPVSILALSPNILVAHPSVKVETVAQLVALARARPGQLTFGTGGPGSTSHVAAEMFNKMAAVDIRPKHYDGAAPATKKLVEGEVSVLFSVMAPTVPHVKAGALSALAVTGDRRSRAFPHVQTLVEAGYPDFRITTWQGLLAPAGTPDAIIEYLNELVVGLMCEQFVDDWLLSRGFDAFGSTPAQFTERLHQDLNSPVVLG